MLRGPDHIAMRGGGRSISAMPLGGDDARGRACPTYEVTWTSTTPSSSLASFPCMHAPQAASLWGVSNWDNPREDVPAGERLVLLNDDLIKATGHRRRHVGIDFLDLNLTEKVVRFDCYTISSSGRLPPFSGFSTGPGQVPERSSVWQIDAPPIIKSKESESKGPQEKKRRGHSAPRCVPDGPAVSLDPTFPAKEDNVLRKKNYATTAKVSAGTSFPPNALLTCRHTHA